MLSVSLTFVVLLALTGHAIGSHPSPYHHPTSPPQYGYHSTPVYPHHSSPAYEHHGGYKHHYCDPKVPPACAKNTSLPFCLEDYEYPAYEIKAAISEDHLFAKKYADIATQSADDLVEHITHHQEEHFDYSFYTGASTGHHPYDVTHWSGPEGYACPSDVIYAMPKRAQNVAGEWRVIVNDVHYYTQTARVETCLFPDAACRALAPCYNSKCTQKHIYHRMLSYDPCDPYKGLFIDIYSMPGACSCHVPNH